MCFADDFPLISFDAEHREHEHCLASVAKHRVWQETEQPVISAETLMENSDRKHWVCVHLNACVRAVVAAPVVRNSNYSITKCDDVSGVF